ncbi:MAG: NAD(P)/FAD-dependent oxidoreductase [Cellulosilyticaceae bacterium]
MLEIAIIGSGPAGLSAAINAKIRNKDVKIFGNDYSTSYIYKAERIDNYIGMHGVTGKEMMKKFVEHALEMGVTIENKKVLEIFPMGDYYTLNVENEFIEARTVILANGITKAKLLPGEEVFLGRGVSYCATCDGQLYRDKKVAVIGDTVHSEEDVQYLSEICEKVYYIPMYAKIGELGSNVEVIKEKPVSILGEGIVSKLKLENKTLDVSGVFIIKESIPTGQLLKGLEFENNAIKVNQYMETNMKGVYAAGDCTGKPFQVAKAGGQGTTAALQAVTYLHELSKA